MFKIRLNSGKFYVGGKDRRVWYFATSDEAQNHIFKHGLQNAVIMDSSSKTSKTVKNTNFKPSSKTTIRPCINKQPWEPYSERDKEEDIRIKTEQEHERTFGDQHLDEKLAAIFPWNEELEDYYNPYPNPSEMSPEEEEFNDLFAEAVFKGAINTEPAPNKLTNPEAIYYRWQALFNHNPDKTIKTLQELIK